MNYGDDRINVATATRDGVVKYYGRPDETGFRPYLNQQQCRHYGEAMLIAQEYVDNQRRVAAAPKQ